MRILSREFYLGRGCMLTVNLFSTMTDLKGPVQGLYSSVYVDTYLAKDFQCYMMSFLSNMTVVSIDQLEMNQ